MWFDTHAHLSDAKFDTDRDEAIRRALKNGVSRIAEIADGPAEWPKAQRLAEQFPDTFFWTAGLHPYFADQGSSEILAALARQAAHPQFVAIGEIGLDYARCPIPSQTQIATFRSCLKIALSVHKPVVIHCRDAFADLLPVLQEFFGKGESVESPGVIHCFSGGDAEADACLEMGFYLGIDGPITYPSAKVLRETLQRVPLDRLVLETDSPYLPPQTMRGQRNEPAFLPQVGTRLAEIKKMSPSDICQPLFENSLRLFRQKPAAN